MEPPVGYTASVKHEFMPYLKTMGYKDSNKRCCIAGADLNTWSRTKRRGPRTDGQ